MCVGDGAAIRDANRIGAERSVGPVYRQV